jgi:[ribosomal protein S18]-alanine N-acetyltransferase
MMTPYGVFLGPAQSADVPALAALESRSFSHPWTPAAFEQAVRGAGNAQVVVLRSAQRDVVGYCVFRIVAEELEIHNLALDPSYRGFGLGRRLVCLVLWLGARRGARTALLEVRTSNWPALRLYRSLGFETAGRRRDYYAEPREDALVLRKDAL